MKDLRELHHRAMEWTDEAFQARREGREHDALACFREAYLLERQAADLTVPRTDMEPTRSVLHRSAATLAVDCGEIEEAKCLIARGLEGQPPSIIANELREVRARIAEIEAQTTVKETVAVA